jgi:cell shape-determining protein MreC
MIYHPANRYLVFGLLVFLVLLGLVLFKNATNILVAASKPLWLVGDYWGEKIYTLSSVFVSKTRLLLENKKLTETIAALEAKLVNHELLAEDLRTLREDCGRNREAEQPIIARVLSNVWQNPYDVILVDVGWGNRRQDFAVGDLVRAHGSILLGRVAAVDEFSSRIGLFSTPGTEIPVTVGREAVPALAVGRGGGNFNITLPRSLAIASGDPVTVPSFGVEVILGTVGAVDKDSSNSLQTLYLRLPFNLSNLKYVAIYPG